MKNKILKGGLLFLLTLSISCQKKEEAVAVTAPVIDKEQIKTEIQTIETELADVYNTGNIDNLNYYADEATSFFNGKMPLVGKEVIKESMKEELANFPKGNKINFETKEIYVGDNADHVMEVGTYKITDSTGVKVKSGNYFSLFKKINGKYQSIRDISNSESPE